MVLALDGRHKNRMSAPERGNALDNMSITTNAKSYMSNIDSDFPEHDRQELTRVLAIALSIPQYRTWEVRSVIMTGSFGEIANVALDPEG